jgi:hypothetical protein
MMRGKEKDGDPKNHMYKVALAATAALFMVGGVASFAFAEAWPYDYGGGNSGNYGTFDYSVYLHSYYAMASGVTCGVVHYCTTNYGYGYGGPAPPPAPAAAPCVGYYCNGNSGNDGQKVIINVNGGTANIFVNQGKPAYSTYSGYSGPDDDSTQTAPPPESEPYHNDSEQSYYGYGGPGG